MDGSLTPLIFSEGGVLDIISVFSSSLLVWHIASHISFPKDLFHCLMDISSWTWIDRNSRSRSCPFCRGNLKRVSSKDLWVLTSPYEVVDSITIARENLSRFYLYIESLPLVSPDTHLFVYDYMIWVGKPNQEPCQAIIEELKPICIYDQTDCKENCYR